MSDDERQRSTDAANAAFWDELCGSDLARTIGITEHSVQSLQRYDDAYFATYPYLLDVVRPWRMRGARVLEIGLGFGTLGEALARHARDYIGVDLAGAPVAAMQHRLMLGSLNGTAVVASAHHLPFDDASVDFVVSIGCFHHTGSLQRCIDEAARVLRPEGTLVFMVYNKVSLRRVSQRPLGVLKDTLAGRIDRASPEHAWDTQLDGAAAPETAFFTTSEIANMMTAFAPPQFKLRNVQVFGLHGWRAWRRQLLLATIGPLAGSDIYIEARKR